MSAPTTSVVAENYKSSAVLGRLSGQKLL